GCSSSSRCSEFGSEFKSTGSGSDKRPAIGLNNTKLPINGRKNPTEVTMMELDGTTHPGKATEAPRSLRLLGESRLAYIRLDKSTLREADIPHINSLHALFPEAKDGPQNNFGTWPHSM